MGEGAFAVRRLRWRRSLPRLVRLPRCFRCNGSIKLNLLSDEIQSVLRYLCLASLVLFQACSGIPKPPPGPETERSFTTGSTVAYQDAYRSIARHSATCFAKTGFFSSINHSVQSDLDSVEKVGRVEVYSSGLLNMESKDEDRKSYVTTVGAKGQGSEVTTTGPTRNGAFIVHSINMQWVRGDPSCTLQR